MNIVLIGNPNAGKTTLFNALTHSYRKTGNWHGVTVDAFSKTVRRGGLVATVTDAPGLYSLRYTSPEEEAAVSALSGDAIVVNVIEASALERSLALTRELASKGCRLIVALTMTDELKRRQGKIDAKKLSECLRVPVFVADEKKGNAASLWKLILSDAARTPVVAEKIPPSVFSSGTYREGRFEKLCYHPVFSLIFFFAFVAFSFWFTFASAAPGGWLKGGVEALFARLESAARGAMSDEPEALRSFVCDGIIRSGGSVLSFLPQILCLQFCLILLEESGYLSILSFVADDLFVRFGLTGRTVFSLLMGFGCTAAAMQTTKTCDRCMQKKLALCLPYFSCSAKLPVYLTVVSAFFERPFLPILCLYLAGVAIALIVSVLSGVCPVSLPAEVAPLRLPSAKNVLKSLYFSAKSTIMKTVTVVLAFLLLSWFLSSFDFSMHYGAERSMLASLCSALRFLFYPMGIRDWRCVYAALSGLVAKENVAGLLQLFYPEGLPFTLASAAAFATFVLTCSPCVSAIASVAEAIGIRLALRNALIQTVTALVFAYAAYGFVSRPYLLLFLLPAGFAIERIYRRKTAKSQIVYR